MRRKLLAAAWIAGATVPLLMAVVFVAGCCALPFHHVIHKLMPVCELAMSVIRGDHTEDHDATPAQQKEEPVKRMATSLPRTFRVAVDTVAIAVTTTPAAHRTFISLGAVRCDQDVGLHVLVETFRI